MRWRIQQGPPAYENGIHLPDRRGSKDRRGERDGDGFKVTVGDATYAVRAQRPEHGRLNYKWATAGCGPMWP